MACHYPIYGYRSQGGGFTTNKGQAYGDLKRQIACGRCMGCRIDKSTAWAIRCTHEAQMHKKNCFVTLTYDQTNLPNPPSLEKKELQLFFDRLRRHFKKKVRYFAAGEYGSRDNTERPHYHALLFGIDFDDKIRCRQDGEKIDYTSKTLDKIWGKGKTEVAELTFKTANYCAKYTTKTFNGPSAAVHYERTDEWGEVYQLLPEFALMSRNKGIGLTWLQKYASDVFPCDYIVIAGKKKSVPPYYFRKLEETNPKIHRQIELKKIMARKKYDDDNTPERLKVRARSLERKIQFNQRHLK